MPQIKISITTRVDVKPDEIAAYFDISPRQAKRFFARGWILAAGDFDKAVKVGGYTWRGDRMQWEAIKERQPKN
jgi:hypothetical protein